MANSEQNSWKVELAFDEGCDFADGFRRISGLLEKLDDFLDTIPDLTLDGKNDLRLVCDEIGSNVVRHSTPEKPTRLDVELDLDGDAVRMRVLDNGSPFNPLLRQDPYIGEDLDKRETGGLGLFLIHQLFPLAAYQYADGWNIVQVEYFMGEDGRQKMQRTGEEL